MKEKRLIALCADDFAFNAKVSEGLLNLIEKKNVTAVSCMTNRKCWDLYGEKLKAHKGEIDIGLHLNLTEEIFLNEKECSLLEILLHSHVGLLQKTRLYKLLEDQMISFIKVMGCVPDFIDGHQHIHHLPVVRFITLELQKKYAKKAYIRSVSSLCFLSFNTFIKSLVLNFTGALRSSRLWDKQGLLMNKNFSGLRSFKEEDFSKYFSRLLKKSRDGTLVMCHPGLKSHLGGAKDPINLAREGEYKFFMSKGFKDLLEKENISLVKPSAFILS